MCTGWEASLPRKEGGSGGESVSGMRGWVGVQSPPREGVQGSGGRREERCGFGRSGPDREGESLQTVTRRGRQLTGPSGFRAELGEGLGAGVQKGCLPESRGSSGRWWAAALEGGAGRGWGVRCRPRRWARGGGRLSPAERRRRGSPGPGRGAPGVAQGLRRGPRDLTLRAADTRQAGTRARRRRPRAH